MTRHLSSLFLCLSASGLVLLAAQSAPVAPRPTTLASADFDEDGMPDLVVGYSNDGGGAIVLHRGNVDALYPNAPEAQRRRAEGVFEKGAFLPGPSRVALDFAVDFLGAGDFDNDGHQDVLAGTRGWTSLHVLRGDGRGGLSLSADIALDGRLNALAIGDVNKTDGVPDVVVGINGEFGSYIAVFESPRGVVGSKPEIVRLPAPPTLLTLGRIRSTAFVDIVAAAGEDLFILEGRNRRLLLDESGESQTAPVRLDSVALPSSIESLVWGNFLWEPTPREELAITTTDGRLVFLDLEDTNGTIALNRVEAEHEFAPGTMVLPTRLSGLSTQDLLILDPADRPVQAMSGLRRPDAQPGGEAGPPRVELAGLERWSHPELKGRPIAVLPMRLNTDARPDLVLLQEGAPSPAFAITSPQAVITVNTSLDNVTAGDGLCTLREAISNANANADTTGGDCAAGVGLDTISFAIGGGGAVASIAVAGSSLPIINDSVVIDGTTQGCAAPPCVELNGTAAGSSAGVRLEGAAGGNTVRGLVINRFTGNGIYGTTSGNIVEGNRIGTNQTGMVDQGNGGSGIRMQGSGATFNSIGGKVQAARNLVSGNTGDGIFLNLGAANNEVLGNHVGINAAGSGAIPNSIVGIEVDSATSNTIGGSSPGSGNVSSGNTQQGIFIDVGASSNTILGNYVGVNPAGTAAIGNTLTGLYVNASSNVIGGTAPGARNVVSGNSQSGILINSSSNNEVLGNYVGLNATGTVAIPNAFAGVAIQSATQNTVGGVVPGARNVVAGNGQNGVYLTVGSSNNNVLGNYIGVDPAGATAIPNQTYGVRVIGASNTIGGLVPEARNVISGNLRDGVFMSDAATGNVVSGNYIGVDATGTVAIGNGWSGVEIQSSPSNTIGGEVPGAGNVIAASILYHGVMIGTSDGTVVKGNLIGTDALGGIALGNGNAGVRVYNSSNCAIGGTTPGARNLISGNTGSGVEFLSSNSNNVVGNFIGTNVRGTGHLGNNYGIYSDANSSQNTIGGTSPGAGNLISGNFWGLYLSGSADVVQGNLIGTDASGTAAVGNDFGGVLDGGQLCTIGGTTPGARNVISGNVNYGFRIFGTASTSNVVMGNYIGTDVSGMTALTNGWEGISIWGAPSNTIGGAAPGAGNVISGNTTHGVLLYAGASGNTVLGNWIGTDVTGAAALGNAMAGVRIVDSTNNRIGGTVAGEGNRIVNNGTDGVIVTGTSTGNPFIGNSIAGNGGLGIELGSGDGVTANDPGDADTGPNALQNHPVLTSALASPSGTVTIGGSLDSTPLATFRVEFFASESCDASGHGEGRRFLGSTDVTTDGSGTAVFSTLLTAPVGAGEAVTATATSSTNDTSEFSACAPVSCSSMAVFPHSVLASDEGHLSWAAAVDVRWVKGNIAGLKTSYTTLANGALMGATDLDISADVPAAGTGFYYLVRPLACGSWQTTPGGQPGRDLSLP